jgi:hypothetical protein
MSANMRLQENSQHKSGERRLFPRIQASCLVRYAGKNFDELGVAELRDYSAGGVCMISDSILLNSSMLRIELLPEKQSRVPHITAEAVVVRCGMREDHRYDIACKLIKVNRRRDNTGRVV